MVIPYAPNEDLQKIFGDMSAVLNYNVSDMNVQIYRPIKNKANLTSTMKIPIIMKFPSVNDKITFYKLYLSNRNLNLSNIGFQNQSRIFINENLTKKNNTIYKAALNLKKQKSIVKTFTKNGQIFVLTKVNSQPMLISSLEQINLL